MIRTGAVMDSQRSDAELIFSLKAGDSSAFSILYNRHKQSLAANLLKLLKSEELTFDLLQDLFLKVWENRNQINPEKSFGGYLFTIAENMVADYYRRAARDTKMQLAIMQSTTEIYSYIEENLLFRENSALLREAVALMPTQRRKVFTLCKLEGKSYKEIEEIMGINAKTINSHLFQASKFLKAYFNDQSRLITIVIVSAIVENI